MKVKMTQRDKVLLLVLVIILIIFGAVMIPTYGIKDLITNKGTLAEKIDKQTSENLTMTQEVVESGIPAPYADKPLLAKKKLEQVILDAKYSATLIANGICSYCDSYAVRVNWLDDCNYLEYLKDEENLFTNYEDDYAPSETLAMTVYEVGKDELVEDNNDATVYSSTHDIILKTVGVTNTILIESTGAIEENILNTYGYLLFYLRNLEKKGSIYLKSYEIDETSCELQIIVLMAGDENSILSDYADEIKRCDTCGEIYDVDKEEEHLATHEEE